MAGCFSITIPVGVTWRRSLPSAPPVLPSAVCVSGDSGLLKSNGRVKSHTFSDSVSSNLHPYDNVSTPCSRRPVGARSRWPPLVPRPLTYSTKISDVDPVQLSELWALTLKVYRDPKKIMKALRHTYAFVVVLAEDENATTTPGYRSKLVGVGRAVSDGAFIATICDVAVHPSYQRRGIGRRIVKQLVQDMKTQGGPSGFAVFPPPNTRRFFWMIGFRAEKKYCIMAYRGNQRKDGEEDESL